MHAVRRLEGSIGHQQRRVVPFFLSGALVNLHARVEIERDTKNIEVAQRIDGESEDPRVRESEVETARSRNLCPKSPRRIHHRLLNRSILLDLTGIVDRLIS